MIRPSLKTYDITDMRLTMIMTLSDDFVGRIYDLSPPNDSDNSIFLDSYKRCDVSHRAWVYMSEMKKKHKDTYGRKFRIEFNYNVGRGGRLSKYLPRISDLIDILSSADEPIDIRCQVNFFFDRRRNVRPIIHLPMKLIDLPDMPFDEIDGLHFVKKSGQLTEYDVILGLSYKGGLRESVFFDHCSRIQESLADEIIMRATSISERFVLKED